MQLIKLAILALATSVSAVSVQLIKNYCLEDVYLTLAVNVTENNIGPFILPSGEAYVNNITGVGNEAIITKDPNLFSDTVGKLVLGSSTAEQILYWSVNNISGDPMAGEYFDVISDGTVPNVCQNSTGYDGQVHACADQDVTLTLNLC